MRELVTERIDDNEYEFLQIPVKQSLRILTRLLKLVGEPMGQAAGAFGNGTGGNILDREINFDLLGKAMGALTEKLDEDLVVNTISELLEHVNVKNDGGCFVRMDMELFFGRRIGHLLKVVRKTLEVNYADFLGDITGVVSSKIAKATTQEKQT